MRTGELFHNGYLVGLGYSGQGEGRNNSKMQGVKGTGPIPLGKYEIGQPYIDALLGGTCMQLEPVGHDAFGRINFRIFGETDKFEHASKDEGLIFSQHIRDRIATSGDRSLEVV